MKYNALASGLAGLPPKHPRVAFWNNPKAWPEDSKDHIFAARAILELGRTLYGNSWSDDCPATMLSLELPEFLTIYTPVDEIRRGAILLSGAEGSYRERATAGLLGPVRFIPTDEEWKQAVSLAQTAADESWSRFAPYVRVSDVILKACKRGDVITATRALEGGEFFAKRWHFWNSENAWLRFDTCRVDEANPFAPVRISEGGSWLFFERESLGNLKIGLRSTEQSGPVNEAELKERATRRRPAGRPRVHNWEEMVMEFTQMCARNEVTEETTTRGIAVKLSDWAAERWAVLPEVSTIEDKVRTWRQFSISSG